MGRIWTGRERKGDDFRSPERIQGGKGDFTQVGEYVSVKKCGKKGKMCRIMPLSKIPVS